MSSLNTLLHEIIDYAGLYPPAGLPLPEVVSNFSGYRQHPAAWMLARLIIPVNRLSEFAETARTSWSLSEPEQLPWRISCLVPAPEDNLQAFEQAWQQIMQFNQTHSAQAVIDAVETKCDSVPLLQKAATICQSEIATYWELPHTRSCTDLLSTLAALGPAHRAKIRTGGVQAQLIAAVQDVARFLHECAAARVAFKATAGLHHPLRAEYRLTYEANSPCATMHGFLNVFSAAVAAWSQRASTEQIADLLTNSTPAAFQFGESGFSIGNWHCSQEEIQTTRERFAIGFGSCSFSEPVEDLRELGWLNWEPAEQHP
jgi:hypothetical protein